MTTDPYQTASFLDKISSSRRIVFLDIDSTLTGDPLAASEVGKKLDKDGCVVVFVTSRTEEMIMSEDAFTRTDPTELKRPRPHLKKETDGRFGIADPKMLTEHSPFVDGDIIAGSTGSRIFIRQAHGGYRLDKVFEESMGEDSVVWRSHVITLLSYVDPEKKVTLSAVDRPENFKEGKVDVYPPNYRVQLEFTATAHMGEGTGSTSQVVAIDSSTRDALFARKKEFVTSVDALRSSPTASLDIKNTLKNICITDDSNPDKGRYQIYVMPCKAGKGSAVERIIESIVTTTGISRANLETVFVGDSYPDVSMGLYGALGTKATFIIAGGSRLTPVFTDRAVTEFAGEDFSYIKSLIHGDLEKGVLEFNDDLHANKRRIIVADKVFPGKNPPQSVLAGLEFVFGDKS